MDGGADARRQLAAAVIQRCWRSCQLRRLYRFYRDLIREREKGDAATLLRMVNPKEAGLASDAALGVHVRLRLGGLQFPPTVYYKIFTHRSVADIGAFAPRDYVLQQKLDRPRHLKTSSELTDVMDEVGRLGWYQRIENNGWRPISHRVLANPDDPITVYTAARKMVFKPLPTLRREEKAKLQKQRKRDWMMRLHREGKGGTADNPAYGGRSELSPGRDGWDGEEADDDQLEDDAGELLAWSQALDFEAYRESWTSMATTMATDSTVPMTLEQLKEATQYTEPFNRLQLPGVVPGLRQF